MDAPLFWLDGGSQTSDLADTAHTGNIPYEVLLLALGAIGTCLIVRNRTRLRLRGPMTAMFLAYLICASMSVVWAEDPSLTLRRLAGFTLILLFSAGCAARMNVDMLSIFLAGIAVLGLVPGIMAEIRCGTFKPLASGYRFGGTQHPNAQGMALCVALIILCWWAWRIEGRARLGVVYIGVLVLTFALLTRSRTSIMATAVALGFSIVMIMVTRRDSWLPVLGLLGTAVGVMGLAGLAVGSVVPRVDAAKLVRSERDDGDVTTLTGRVDIWRACLAVMGERSLLGVGFGGFWSERRIEAVDAQLPEPIVSAHSAYIEEFLTLGVAGAALYVAMLMACLIACARRFLRGDVRYGVWAALVVFMIIHGFTESPYFLPPNPYFAFITMTQHLSWAERYG